MFEHAISLDTPSPKAVSTRHNNEIFSTGETANHHGHVCKVFCIDSKRAENSRGSNSRGHLRVLSAPGLRSAVSDTSDPSEDLERWAPSLRHKHIGEQGSLCHSLVRARTHLERAPPARANNYRFWLCAVKRFRKMELGAALFLRAIASDFHASRFCKTFLRPSQFEYSPGCMDDLGGNVFSFSLGRIS